MKILKLRHKGSFFDKKEMNKHTFIQGFLIKAAELRNIW
jgi:hypothetical protein